MDQRRERREKREKKKKTKKEKEIMGSICSVKKIENDFEMT